LSENNQQSKRTATIPFARSATSFTPQGATSLGVAHIICDLSQHHLRHRRNIIDAKHHIIYATRRNIIGRSPHHLRLVATSFEAKPQPRSFVPKMNNDVLASLEMMLYLSAQMKKSKPIGLDFLCKVFGKDVFSRLCFFNISNLIVGIFSHKSCQSNGLGQCAHNSRAMIVIHSPHDCTAFIRCKSVCHSCLFLLKLFLL